MVKCLDNIHTFMLFLVMESLDKESRFLSFCMMALTMLSIECDLPRLRPSNFYHPDGFYPAGAYDDFWTRNEELFFNKFRFRRNHFHRLMKAMGLEDTQLVCGVGGNKYRADSCLLVVLKRISYPYRFWEMTEDIGLPSWRRARRPRPGTARRSHRPPGSAIGAPRTCAWRAAHGMLSPSPFFASVAEIASRISRCEHAATLHSLPSPSIAALEEGRAERLHFMPPDGTGWSGRRRHRGRLCTRAQ